MPAGEAEASGRQAGRDLEHLLDLAALDRQGQALVDGAVPTEQHVLERRPAGQPRGPVERRERRDQEPPGAGLERGIAQPVPVPDVAGEMGGRADASAPAPLRGHGSPPWQKRKRLDT